MIKELTGYSLVPLSFESTFLLVPPYKEHLAFIFPVITVVDLSCRSAIDPTVLMSVRLKVEQIFLALQLHIFIQMIRSCFI